MLIDVESGDDALSGESDAVKFLMMQGLKAKTVDTSNQQPKFMFAKRFLSEESPTEKEAVAKKSDTFSDRVSQHMPCTTLESAQSFANFKNWYAGNAD